MSQILQSIKEEDFHLWDVFFTFKILKFKHVIGAGGLSAHCFSTQCNLGRKCTFERKTILVRSVLFLMAVDVVQMFVIIKVALVESG